MSDGVCVRQCAVEDTPFLPKVAQLLHRLGCTTHACKQDVDPAFAYAPKGVAKVEIADVRVWGRRAGIPCQRSG